MATSGALWVMPCPARDHAAQVMAHLQGLGINTILSMLPMSEAQELGMQDEAALCAASGIRFLSHPIPDFGLPELKEFSPLVHGVADELQSGRSIAIHCRAGIGRTGMVAACTLVTLGESAESAIKKISNARGVSIPDTVEQGRFIATFAEHVNKGKDLSL